MGNSKMKKIKLFIIILNAISAQQCAESDLPSLENGSWACDGTSPKDKCYASCDERFVLESESDSVKCKCNKNDVCTWRPKTWSGQCYFLQVPTTDSAASTPTTTTPTTARTTTSFWTFVCRNQPSEH